MKTWIYSWLIYPALYSLAKCFGLFNSKVRETLKLRSWKDFLSLRFNAGQPIEYWIHVASYGELEYAIPILRELGNRGKRVLVTYYSISAKTPVEQLPSILPNVSLVVPLPHDGLGLMKEFVSLAHQQGVRNLLLLKYELWPGLLWECNAKEIKVFLVDALKPSWFHRRLLHKLTAILAGYNSEIDPTIHKKSFVVGDTRVERVLDRVRQNNMPTVVQGLQTRLELVLNNHRKTFVCGSMWPADTKLILSALQDLKISGDELCNIIWVPHELEIQEERQTSVQLESLGYKVLTIDQLANDTGDVAGTPIAITVLKKGILVELYKFGQLAFVGGGFGSGVHSVWEPALASCVVACGPRTERSPESAKLAEIGVLQRVSKPIELKNWIKQQMCFGNEKKQYMIRVLEQHIGAAKRIIDICEGNAYGKNTETTDERSYQS